MADRTKKSYIIGVDTGGTFTDVVVCREGGEILTSKAPSTPQDFSVGIMDGLQEAAKSMDMSRDDLLKQSLMFKHGTTVATNALITRTGSKVGFITTKGFEDTTLIGRATLKVDGLSAEEVKHMACASKPEPIVPKSRLKGVYERIDYAGNIVVPLNMEDAGTQIRSLVEEKKVDAIGVSFLFSWVNPIHEQKIKDLINRMYPNHELFLTFSHELVPVIREYGRANTVILNCFVGKTMEGYIKRMDQRLSEEGFEGSLMIMQANGGIAHPEELVPVRTLSSGPAGGAIATQYVAGLCGHQNVVSTDMGGTSFDVGLIIDGHYRYATEPIVSRWRLIHPMIEITSIGAGGGTIARTDLETHRVLSRLTGRHFSPIRSTASSEPRFMITTCSTRAMLSRGRLLLRRRLQQ
jgi:N-methylhydantoinase A